jgi:hypothetical protein
MSEFLKHIYDGWSERIRSPILGLILIAHILFNWKAYFVLFFSTGSVYVRILNFEQVTTPWSLYFFPITAGVIYAFAAPYIRYFGALLALVPNRWLRKLQVEEATGRRIVANTARAREIASETALDIARKQASADVQAAEEAAIISAKKRELEAVEQAGEDAKAAIIESREAKALTIRERLSPYAKKILQISAEQGEPSLWHKFEQSSNSDAFVLLGQTPLADKQENRRRYSEILKGIDDLLKAGLLYELPADEFFQHYDIDEEKRDQALADFADGQSVS